MSRRRIPIWIQYTLLMFALTCALMGLVCALGALKVYLRGS